MPVFTKPSDLPEKIERHVVGEIRDNYIVAFKPNIKPNATIPLLWLVAHKEGLLFCNTHRTRGVFREIAKNEIDSFRFSLPKLGEPSLQIIFSDIYEDDLFIELPSAADAKELNKLYRKLGVQILDS